MRDEIRNNTSKDSSTIGSDANAIKPTISHVMFADKTTASACVDCRGVGWLPMVVESLLDNSASCSHAV